VSEVIACGEESGGDSENSNEESLQGVFAKRIDSDQEESFLLFNIQTKTCRARQTRLLPSQGVNEKNCDQAQQEEGRCANCKENDQAIYCCRKEIDDRQEEAEGADDQKEVFPSQVQACCRQEEVGCDFKEENSREDCEESCWEGCSEEGDVCLQEKDCLESFREKNSEEVGAREKITCEVWADAERC